MKSVGSDKNQFASALRETGVFVYRNSHRLVVISLGWTLASLPLVTLGPASLGAYTAINQLESDRNRIEPGELLSVVRRRFASAVLFGAIPPLFFGIAGLYLVAQASDPSTIRAAMFFVTLYIALYAGLVMIPTFIGLVDGESPHRALKNGIHWTARHPTLALLTGLITVVILTISLLLTIAFPLLFAGCACSFHTHLVDLEEFAD